MTNLWKFKENKAYSIGKDKKKKKNKAEERKSR